ncbi:hypothetical protein PRIPAC_86654 [Pristionchus pacificus]|nr:hypothetical protein PRIPAC_86654 [Pristionchus pacificus]
MRPLWMGVMNRRYSLGVKVEDASWVGDKTVFACLDGTVKIAYPHSNIVESSQVASCPLFGVSPLGQSKAVFISHSSMLYYFNVEEKIIVKSVSLGIETRLFSLATLGECVAIGGLDSLWILNGHNEKKEMKLGRIASRMGTIVWSVLFVRDGLVASGDSTGTVSFWNTHNATLITSIIRHEADVLSLCLLNGTIYAAGVDPTIVVIEEMSCGEWKDTLTKRIVTRDVRCMTGWGNAVYGGGCDDKIFRIGTKPQSLNILPIHSHTGVKCDGMYSLITNIDHVLVWSTDKGPNVIAKIFSYNHLPITASSISSDGSVIGISTRESTCLYSLNGNIVSKVRGDLPPSSILIHHPSSHLFVVSYNIIYRLEGIDGELSEIHRLDSECVITSLSIDNACSSLCVITSRSSVYRINLTSPPSSLCLRLTLPILSAFSSSSLFVLSSNVSSPNSPSLFSFPLSSSSPSSSFSSHSFFQLGYISSLASSSLGLLISSDEESWTILSPTSQILSLSHSSGKSTEKEILSLGIYDSSLRVLSTQPPIPSILPFKSKRFGMQ